MAHILLIGPFMQRFCTLEFLSLQRAMELKYMQDFHNASI